MTDLTTEFGQRVDQCLMDEEVIWFTTVTPDDVAPPNPVWFFWDGESIILYRQPGSYRIRNIQHNPKVTLNLEGADVSGHNVVVIQGEAQLKPDHLKPHPGYEKKYSKYLPEVNWTITHLVADYSVEITIRPSRMRGG
jgi:PPOX class probable F420-dependent enzyme